MLSYFGHFLCRKTIKKTRGIIDLFNQLRHVRYYQTSFVMANSKWEYVKTFESEDALLPNCWTIARIDGRGFHKLAKTHNWKRPNDERAIQVMNKAAHTVMREYNDIVLAYGQSDEYSFLLRRETEIFERRSVKIITTLVSKFSSAYVFYWKNFFPAEELLYPPSFDGRLVLYPTDKNLRDYLCWRQADCHINNLYNTTFWSLVQLGGMTNNDAQRKLSGTLSKDKNEILFSQFGINYNNEPELFRKGTVLIKKQTCKKLPKKSNKQKTVEKPENAEVDEDISELSCDIIGDTFWNDNPHILNPVV